MNICVLRRNRRKTASGTTSGKREFALFSVSLVLVFAALVCFAWTIPARSSPQQTNPQTSESHAQADAQDPVYTGRIASSSSHAASSASASSSSAHEPSTAPPSPATENAAAMETESSQRTHAEELVEQSYEQVYETQGEQGYQVIHHTAYQAIPVYTTVHHQASTPREVTVNGSTRVEWTTCPVCGQQHDGSYNERVVDHMNEVFCTACGGTHNSSYDEVVYG